MSIANLKIQGFDPTADSGGLDDPSTAYNLLSVLFSNMIELALIAGAITAFIYIIIGAFQWGTAAAGDGKAKARQTILYAVAGLIMLSLVYVFISIYNGLLPAA